MLEVIWSAEKDCHRFQNASLYMEQSIEEWTK